MSATHKIATPDMPDGEFFFSVMRDSDAGQMLHQLDDHCKALISSVLKFGGKGSVTLKLSVSKCGEERQVLIKPTVKADVPSATIRDRLLYADEQGRLHLNDPAQGLLDFDAPVRVTGVEVTASANTPTKL